MCWLTLLFVSQDDGKITISDSDSDEERIPYQSEPVPSQAAGNKGSLNLLTPSQAGPGFSFVAGGRTFGPVVSHSVSGKLKQYLRVSFLFFYYYLFFA